MVSQLKAVKNSGIQRSGKVVRHPLLQAIEGTLQIFTSVHRGFFTNVMVQAFRAADQGLPVLIVQFLKGGIDQGAENASQLGQGLDWWRCAYEGCVHGPEQVAVAKDAVQTLWQQTQAVVSQGKYGLVVLDELSLAIDYGLIEEAEVVAFLADRPPQIDVILTGPQMPYTILAMADQVTEFRRQVLP